MTLSHQDVPPCQWFSRLAAFLDRYGVVMPGGAGVRTSAGLTDVIPEYCRES
jgi:hypothetical protein